MIEMLKLFSSVNWLYCVSMLSVVGDLGMCIFVYGLFNGMLGFGVIDGWLWLSVYGCNLIDKLFIVCLCLLLFGLIGSYF